MQTMQSVILYAADEWSAAELPREQLEGRLQAVRSIMRARGWKALIVQGDARENALLCYLTGFVPYLRWGLALVGREGPLRLVAAVGPRDRPAVQRLTHVEDVRATADVHGAITDWLATVPAAPSDGIAIANLAHMHSTLARAVQTACQSSGGAEDAGDAFASLLCAGLPGDLPLIGRAHAILQGACETIEHTKSHGQSIKEAIVAAERTARLAGASDVRCLFAPDGRGLLRPLESVSDAPHGEPWSVFLAIRRRGVWVQALTTFARRSSNAATAVGAAVAAAVGIAREGVSVSDLAEAMRPALAGCEPHPVLGDGVCRPCGFSLDREIWLTPSSPRRLPATGAFIIAAGARDAAGQCALASVIVVLEQGRVAVLRPGRSGA